MLSVILKTKSHHSIPKKRRSYTIVQDPFVTNYIKNE